MARLLRETVWHDLREGDVFRVPGLRGRRFRFKAYVTNFDNGDSYVEAVDTRDGDFRAFRPDRPMIRERPKKRGGRANPAPS